MANTKKYEKELGQAKNNIGKNETGVLQKKKRSRLEKYKKEIQEYLNIGVNIKNIHKIINSKHNLDYVYTTYVHYIKNILRS